jgi:hypothetical protein
MCRFSLRSCTESFQTSASRPLHPAPGAFSASFSCIFRRAASIISSLRRCSIFCLSSLLPAQPPLGGSSSFSLPFELIRDCRLYLVIKSGSTLTGCCGLADDADDAVVKEIGGWNDGGAYPKLA